MIEPTNPCRFTAWYDIDTLHAICGKCLASRKDVTQPQQPLLQRDTLVGPAAHDGVNAAERAYDEARAVQNAAYQRVSRRL